MARAVRRIQFAVGIGLTALVLTGVVASGHDVAAARGPGVGTAPLAVASTGRTVVAPTTSASVARGSSSAATVVFRQGVSLPPGTYEAVIQVQERSVQGKIVVAEPGTAVVSPTPAGSPAAARDAPSGVPSTGQGDPGGVQRAAATSGGSRRVELIMIIGLLVAGLGLVLVIWYFKGLVPRRHIREYRKALALLVTEKYREAVPALTNLEGKLPDRLRNDARFFISFGFFEMGDLDEARHRLVTLYREDSGNANVAYLLAYVHVKKGDYEAAEPILEAMHRNQQLDLWHAKRLYGLVEFHRAVAALREGRIDAAAELFEKVEQLGDYRDRIPSDLRNRHAVLGARALFEKNVEAALSEFQSLERAAGRCPNAKQRDEMLATAKLGLALVHWIKDDADDPEAVELDLVEAARCLDSGGPLTATWPDDVDTKSLADRIEEQDRKPTGQGEAAERDRVLRDIHFVRAAAVLRSWANAEGGQASESADEYRHRVLRRLACAIARDPDFSDAFLVAGLLRYYLPAAGGDRARGIAELRRAQELGVRHPEALQLVNHHDRNAKANRDAVDKYLQVLDRYLGDNTVRAQVRSDLIARLSRYGRIREWDRRPDLDAARNADPTVAEMRDRSRLLMERLAQLATTAPDQRKIDEAQGLRAKLEDQSRALCEHAQEVEQSEADLLVLVGDLLLVDQI